MGSRKSSSVRYFKKNTANSSVTSTPDIILVDDSPCRKSVGFPLKNYSSPLGSKPTPTRKSTGKTPSNQFQQTVEVLTLSDEERSTTKSKKKKRKRTIDTTSSEIIDIGDNPQKEDVMIQLKATTAEAPVENRSILTETLVNDSLESCSSRRTAETCNLNDSNCTIEAENSEPTRNKKRRKSKIEKSSSLEHSLGIQEALSLNGTDNGREIVIGTPQATVQNSKEEALSGLETSGRKKKKKKGKSSLSNTITHQPGDNVDDSPPKKRRKISFVADGSSADTFSHSTLQVTVSNEAISHVHIASPINKNETIPLITTSLPDNKEIETTKLHLTNGSHKSDETTKKDNTDSVVPAVCQRTSLSDTIVLSDDEQDPSDDVIVLGIRTVPTIRNYAEVPSKKKSPSRFGGSLLQTPPIRPQFQQNYPPSPIRLPQDVIARAIYELSKTKEGAQMLAAANVQQPEVGVFHFNANRPSTSTSLLPSPANVNGSNIYNPFGSTVKKGLRPIIIDGSNVAMSHGNGKVFSSRGLQICVNYFVKKKHKVFAFMPLYRRHNQFTKDAHLLEKLSEDNHLIFTPSRYVDGRNDVPYDDRYIVQTAAELGGVIVSSDNYRDLLEENGHWHDTIKNRLLMFTWVEDLLIFPQDPLGKRGPSLDKFLRF